MTDNPLYVEVNGESYVKTSYACEQMAECSKDTITVIADNVLKLRPDDRELYEFINGMMS